MRREKLSKIVIGICAIGLMITVGCNIKKTADNNPTPTPIETVTEINPETFINDIDEYVYFIRQHGDNFSIERQKLQIPANSSAVYCKLDGQTVKISILSDSNQTDMVDFYMKDSQLVYMSKNGIDSVDSPNDNVYFQNGQVFKCFRDGNEVSNLDSIKKIGDVSQYATIF